MNPRQGAADWVLLHGFTGTPEDWTPVVGSGAALRAIRIPGHGQAPPPVGDFATEIAALLDTLPARIHHLIGYSLGGRLALAMLAADPTCCAEATLIAAHPGLPDAAARAARRQADARWVRLLREQGIQAFVDSWERQPLFATQERLPEPVRRRQRERRLQHTAEGLAQALEQLGLAAMPSTWEAIRDFPGRMRWIVGGRDTKFMRIAEQVQAWRPSLELQVMADVGHNPLLEAPERLRRLLQPTAPDA